MPRGGRGGWWIGGRGYLGGGGGLPAKRGWGEGLRARFCSCFIERGWYRVCRKITVVSVFGAAWAAVRTWGLLVVELPELEREKGMFSLISPIGVVAGATSTLLGDC